MAESAAPVDVARASRSRGFPAHITPAVILGAALWTFSVVFFIVQVIAIAVFIRPYSFATNLISDLGNTACGPVICSPLHGFMNATFVVVGLCHALGGLATYRAWPRPRLGYVGVQLLVIAGAGLIVAGLSPENLDPGGHARGALTGLAALNLAMLALGWSMLTAQRWLGAATLAAGITGFVGLALFLSGTGSAAITERTADYPSAAIVVILGAWMLASAVSQSRRSVAAPG